VAAVKSYLPRRCSICAASLLLVIGYGKCVIGLNNASSATDEGPWRRLDPLCPPPFTAYGFLLDLSFVTFLSTFPPQHTSRSHRSNTYKI